MCINAANKKGVETRSVIQSHPPPTIQSSFPSTNAMEARDGKKVNVAGLLWNTFSRNDSDLHKPIGGGLVNDQLMRSCIAKRLI